MNKAALLTVLLLSPTAIITSTNDVFDDGAY